MCIDDRAESEIHFREISLISTRSRRVFLFQRRTVSPCSALSSSTPFSMHAWTAATSRKMAAIRCVYIVISEIPKRNGARHVTCITNVAPQAIENNPNMTVESYICACLRSRPFPSAVLHSIMLYFALRPVVCCSILFHAVRLYSVLWLPYQIPQISLL